MPLVKNANGDWEYEEDGATGATSPDFVFGGEQEAGFEEAAFDQFQWWKEIHRDVRDAVSGIAKDYDQDDAWMLNIVDSNFQGLFDHLNGIFFAPKQPTRTYTGTGEGFQADSRPSLGLEEGWTKTPDGYFSLFKAATAYMEGKLGMPGFFDLSGPPKRSGDRGARKPTADEIRASFDLDELARGATALWRGRLLDEPKDSRGMAKAYVEQVVNNPDQKLDFSSFVKRMAEKEPRYASLYQNKPTGLSAEQYLQFYLQPAQQSLGAGNGQLNSMVENAMKLGSDSQGFGARLRASDSNTASSPFIDKAQTKLMQVRRMLK